MAAAVADYRPAEPQADKRSKDDAHLDGRARADPRRRAGARRRHRNGQVLVAFGADHGEHGLERKRRMLDTKHADLVVFNDVGRPDIGFESDDNEVTLVSRAGARTIPKAPKRVIASAVLDEAIRILQERDGRGG